MNIVPTFALGRQRGVALVVLLALLGFVLVGVLLTTARSSNDAGLSQRDVQTMATLGQAREGLIAYATGLTLDASTDPRRPGDLPCPDLDDDGDAEASCTTTALRVGRLPWRTLGLPDLRDAAGERLWYAVSSSFVENPRTPCTVLGQATCLNSNSKGAITVRKATTAVENDGTVPLSAAVAVILAPGPVLKRLDQAVSQDRSCTRGGGTDAQCETSGKCTSPPTLTARCNPINYLDVAQAPQLPVPGASSSKEDNATFTENTLLDGFIDGPMLDTSTPPQVRVNDVLLVVRYSDIMAAMQKRVAREVLHCLHSYAAVPANAGRYPWAAQPDTQFPTALYYFTDYSNTTFGHVADSTQLSSTRGDSSPTMDDTWPADCTFGFNNTNWWMNWKDLVYYGVSGGYSPNPPGVACAAGGCLLTVNPPSPSANKHVVVIVAGSMIGTQVRTTDLDRNNVSNFLEGNNAGGVTFEANSASPIFNDVVVYE